MLLQDYRESLWRILLASLSRVFDRASKAKLVTGVIAAVDDERVYEAVVKNGGTAMMTRKDHATGTDRLAEVAAAHPEAEPLQPAAQKAGTPYTFHRFHRLSSLQ